VTDSVNTQRLQLVMKCYDRLPKHLREWVSDLHFNLHDDHILRGSVDVEGCKTFIENGGQHHLKDGNGQN